MRCLKMLFDEEQDIPKRRLSNEDYENFLKSMQTMSSVNLSVFVKGITISEMSLMYTVEEHAVRTGSPISVAETAKSLNISIPAVSRTLKSLEQKRLILRRPDEKDRRSVKLVLTEEGKTSLKANVCSCLEAINRVLESFSDEELTTMVNIHCKLTKALSEEAEKQKN